MKREMTPGQRRKAAPLFFILMLSLALMVNLSGHLQKKKKLLGKPIQHFDIPLIGRPFSEFTPKSWAGTPVIINIFASWCEPCQLEHRSLLALSKATRIPLYGLAWKDREKNIAAYLEKNGNPFALVALDTEGKVTVPFAMTGVPETFVINRQGLVVFHHSSALNEETIRDELMPLLSKLEQPDAPAR
jgi:cytochrome c biogenesis protein CcmG/thiol:disulfide interchange protein DsbE